MNLGDTFLMSVPPRFDCDHLFFVISDPNEHNGTYIIVNVTGDESRADRECVLIKGDHPWITKECFVAFADALEITPERDAMINVLIGTRVTVQPCLDTAVLAKIITAAKCSSAITRAFKKYL